MLGYSWPPGAIYEVVAGMSHLPQETEVNVAKRQRSGFLRVNSAKKVAS